MNLKKGGVMGKSKDNQQGYTTLELVVVTLCVAILVGLYFLLKS